MITTIMNFVDNDISNKWRNMAGILVLFVFAALFIFFNSDLINVAVGEQIGNGSSLAARVIEEAEVEAGGDVVIDPPPPAERKRPKLVGEMLSQKQIAADSVLVKDRESGVILYSKNSYQAHPIASITKLMSALVLLEHDLNWTATTTVVGDDKIGTHIYRGDVYSLEQLWQAALVASSNKAIFTLAEYIERSENVFVERMNQKATELGMTDTHYTDPSGLDPGNVSSASDVSILLDEALRHEEITNILSMKELSLYSLKRDKEHHMWNTNWLLLNWIKHDFAYLIGKTGYIPASGYNFAMRVGNDRGNEINVIILGAETHEGRFTQAKLAADWSFANHIWPSDTEDGQQSAGATDGTRSEVVP